MDRPSPTHYDFAGWVTRSNLLCSDGRTIMPDAFKHYDGKVVPLVWNHQHDDPNNVLGSVLLHSREGSMYGYALFNATENGQVSKELVEHGDITSLSIYANHLKHNQQRGVLHGEIREVSLVLAGANNGARIESVALEHGDESEDEAIIYTGEGLSLYHADDEETEEDINEETIEHSEKEETPMADNKDKTVQEVYDEMSDEQKTVVHFFVGQALEDAGVEDGEDIEHSFEGGEDSTMKHNIFDQDEYTNDDVLTHDDMQAIIGDAKRYGSMKESFLAHDAGDVTYAEKTQTYGINGTDFLFPEARNVSNIPGFIQRDMGWVQKVMRGVHHTPFSRIKSMFADITEDAARAKGYIKGKLKKEEVFTLLKRTTSPTTVYKKQKMDRDDVNDIVDFDVIAWLKGEMRMMLDEEIARAVLVGDGRLGDDDDKIKEDCIRPIWKDADLFTIKKLVEVSSNASADDKAKAFIRAAIKARKDYKGSGNPTLYTYEDIVTDCLLMEDNTGRIIYDSIEKLATALRVKEIVTVPVMEGLKRTDDENGEVALGGIIVNLDDYNIGADKGGAVNMFDDFDIDYNQQKYLIETRCSGALIKPFSAIALEFKTTEAAAG